MSGFIGFCDFLIVLFSLQLIGSIGIGLWYFLKRERECVQRRAGRNYVKAMQEDDDLITTGGGGEDPIFNENPPI